MADLIELSQWEPGIYQLETDDPVLGGEDGIDNLQAKQLANRTQYLKQEVEARTTQAQVEALIAALVDSSPAALDTLNELAAALGDDPNFATTITNALALKAPLESPALTGTPTAPTQAPGTNNNTVASTAFVQALFATLEAIADASTTVKGIVELATDAETQTGTDPGRAVTPASLSSRTATETRTGLVELATALEAQNFTPNKYIDGAKLASALQGANQSLATSGYQKLPGGLIVQWGTGPFSTGGSSVTFPIAFPTACVRIFGFDDSSNVPKQFSATNKSTTGFTFYVNTGSAANAGYWAIGY